MAGHGSKPGRKGKQTDAARVADRRRQVATLYLQGLSQAVIAERFGISQVQISYDLKSIRKKWLDSALRDFDTLKSEELAKLDQIERVAWQAWNISSTLYDKDGKPTGKLRAGDSRYLSQVFECVETRLKILGLLKPGTTTVNTQVNQTVVDLWAQITEGVGEQDGTDVFEAEIARRVEESVATRVPLASSHQLPSDLKGLPLSKRAQAAGEPPSDQELIERLRRLEQAVNGNGTNGHSSNGNGTGGHHEDE